jgi:hypothetical protein
MVQATKHNKGMGLVFVCKLVEQELTGNFLLMLL